MRGGFRAPVTDFSNTSRASRPYLLSRLNWDRSLDSVARRSPWVRAPSDSNRLATIEANLNIYIAAASGATRKKRSYRFSPANSEIRNTYSGALT